VSCCHVLCFFVVVVFFVVSRNEFKIHREFEKAKVVMKRLRIEKELPNGLV
jgi:hypothetical protein